MTLVLSHHAIGWQAQIAWCNAFSANTLSCAYLAVPKRQQPAAPSRLVPAFRLYLQRSFTEKGNTQTAFAALGGFSQPILSQQMSGERPATLEMVENVARVCNHSGTEILKKVLDAAIDLDKENPGWDDPIERVPADELIARAQAQPASAVEVTRARPKRVGKRQR